MDPYIILLVGFGCLVLLTAWLPMVLSRAPLSLPIVCVAIGAGIAALPGVPADFPHPRDHLAVIERFSELVVIISLMGAGLKLDRRISWKRWILTWRLLGIAMPLTITGLALLGYGLLGLGVASALLLASVLAPTDPVLASDIQVGPPNSGEDGDTRFALTSEAGLNDALAFPFVHAAIALSLVSASSEHWLLHWFSIDVVWKLTAGLAVGIVTGRALGYLVFHLPNRARLSRTGDGFVALGITCIAYGAAELVHGYGFLSVFVSALVLRMQERDHGYHTQLHNFAEELERLLMMALLVAFGGALSTGGLLQDLSWEGVIFGIMALFVIRPLSGWFGLRGAILPADKKAVISVYGIRGVGSIYYLAYGTGHGAFNDADVIWSVVAFIILISIVLHGATASPVMAWIDRHREVRQAMTGGDVHVNAKGRTTKLRAALRSLYFGDTVQARRFRYGLVAFDIVTIAIFIIAASVPGLWWIIPLDFALGALLTLELAARLYAETNRRRHILSLATLTDVVVIGSLFLPALIDNLGFLRIVRALRLLRSYHLLRDLRSGSAWFRRYEDVIQRTLNLAVFIMIVTSFVYVSQQAINPQINSYIDALYFTITTLTTTGFGDITLLGPGGRLLAVVIMVVGVGLFLRLLQAVFSPNKTRFACPDCALQVHDIDAVHCKHCGRVLAIPNEGVA